MNTLISIIVPSYNKQNYISETIQSVINQTYSNWELIIVDDLSDDKTVEIIKSYQQDYEKIKLFINSENKGANYSRNFGIKQAKGEFAIFLDADDLLSPDCLNKRIAYINNSDLDFCVFTLEIFKTQIGDTRKLWNPVTKHPLSDFLSHNLPWQTMQPIWRRNFLVNMGGFNEKFLRLQDVEIHTRALFRKGVRYKLINELPDCFFRVDEERRNFDNVTFLDRWVDSALLYYQEFYDSAKHLGLDKKLMGTIYKSYLQLLYYRKTDRINRDDFDELENKLLDTSIRKDSNWLIEIVFKISSFYNLLPFKIPGINYILSKLVTL